MRLSPVWLTFYRLESICIEFLVVRQTVFVDLFQTFRDLRIVFERLPFDARALLRLVVPLCPHLPFRHLMRLPGEGFGYKGYVQLRTVSSHRTFRVPKEIRGIHYHWVFSVLHSEAEQPV